MAIQFLPSQYSHTQWSSQNPGYARYKAKPHLARAGLPFALNNAVASNANSLQHPIMRSSRLRGSAKELFFSLYACARISLALGLHLALFGLALILAPY